MTVKPAIKVERMHKLSGDGSTRAFCDLLVMDTLVVKGLRVVQGKDGLFLSMPQQQGKDGKWYDTVMPVSKEIRKGLEKMVIGEYQSEVSA
ncbi:MAG TPA: septation protein SpoVG family protein [Candidatus Omnitrophota bacterium]|nr:septation protein SpoVG family protein [Candidatus Omnitrophota bacterium]